MSELARLNRTYQTAPAASAHENSAKYVISGLSSDGFSAPDWFSPDLEDATPPDKKEEGIDNIIEYAAEYPDFSGEIWPRVNWAYYEEDPGTSVENVQDQGEHDIKRLIRDGGDLIDGITVPKVGGIENTRRAHEIIRTYEEEFGYETGSFEMAVIIETAAAMSDLKEIAEFGSESRLIGLLFGIGDFTFDVGGKMQGGGFPDWMGVKEQISAEASKNDLISIGAPYPEIFRDVSGVNFYNGDGYAQHVEAEIDRGFDGSWSLHPKQTIQANRLHIPSREELEEIIRKMEDFANVATEGTGALLIDGDLVDVGMVKYWMNRVEETVAVSERHPKQAQDIYGEDIVERANEVLDIDM